MIINLRERIVSFACYAVVIIWILCTHTVYIRAGMLNYSILKAVALVTSLLLLPLTYGWIIKKPKTNGVWFPILLSFAIYVAFHWEMTPHVLVTYFLPPFVFSLLALFDREKVILKKLIHCFISVMLCIACISLFFFVFGSLLRWIPSGGTIEFDWDKTFIARSYLGIYFEIPWQDLAFFGYTGHRNCGIFVEAPMYNFLLCIALIFQMFILQDKKWKSGILIITVLTTFSTTGIVATIALLALEYITSSGKKQNSRIMLISKMVIIPIVAIASAWGITYIMDMKTTQGIGSILVRSSQNLACLYTFIQTFPMGTGFGERTMINEMTWAMERIVQGMSAGLLYYLATSGLSGVIAFFFPFFVYVWKRLKKRQWKAVWFSCVFFYLVFITNIMDVPIVWFILYFFMSSSAGDEKSIVSYKSS
jgi:hypothetical protein